MKNKFLVLFSFKIYLMLVAHRRRARNPENRVLVIREVFLEYKLIWHLFYFLIRDIHRRHRNTIIKHFFNVNELFENNKIVVKRSKMTLLFRCDAHTAQ